MAAENKSIREKLAEYLADPDKFDCGIVISNQKFIKMPHGNETEYFCPPPQVRLFGQGWKKLFDDAEKTSKSAAASNQLSEQPTTSSAILVPSTNKPGQSKLHFTIGIDPFLYIVVAVPLNLSLEKNQAVNKQLYATNCAEKDYLSLKVNMFRPTQQNAESFISEQMKLESGPRNTILSGTAVAFCNKSQENHTRFLSLGTNSLPLMSVNDIWTSFLIYLVDRPTASQQEGPIVTRLGAIHYGSYVVLADRTTGRWSRIMRIVPVLEGGVVPLDQVRDRNRPVREDEKCAFQVVHWSMQYLSIKDDMTVPYLSALLANEKIDEIRNTEEFSIMSVDETRYRFYEAMGPVSDPVTPVPTITAIRPATAGYVTKIEFVGSNFRKNMKIFFGLYEVCQQYDSTKCIIAFMPTYQQVSSQSGSAMFPVANDEVSFPITIIRNDGVIYSTPYYYHYYISDGRAVPGVLDKLTEGIFPRRLILI